MDCSYDAKPYLKDRINWVCKIPSNMSNETFSCLTYAKFGINTSINSSVLQVNPEKKVYSSPVVGFLSKRQETSDYFESDRGLVNVYFTNKNLVPKTPFIFGCECSSGNQKLVTEHQVVPVFEGTEPLVGRAEWVVTQANLLVGIGIIVVFILFGLYMVWRHK